MDETVNTSQGKKRRHRIRLAGLVFVLIVVAVVLAYVFWPQPGPAKLRIGYSPYSVNVPLFAAEQAGLFGLEGIDAELIPFQSTDLLAAALKGGQIDVATALAAEGVYSSNSKTPGQIRPFFFNTFVGDSRVDALVVPKDSGVGQVKDLAGKKVAILPAEMMRVALRGFLKRNGVDPESITIVVLPPSSVLAALGSGDVDACYILEPLVSVASEKLQARVMAVGVGAKGITDPLPAGFHSIRGELARKQPELVQKLIRIYKKGADAASDRSVASQALVAYCSMKEPLARAVALPRWSVWTPSLEEHLKAQFDAMQPVLKWNEAAYQDTHNVHPE